MYEFLDYLVQDVMSRPVSVRADATLADVERILEKNGFNSLPVVDDADRLIGVVTSLDLLRAFAFPEDSILPPYDQVMKRPVTEVMTQQALTVAPRAPLSRVLQKMVDTRNKSFPVLDGDHLVGVVAREDVMFALRRGSEHRAP